MALELISRSATQNYEEIRLEEEGISIVDLLFPTLDEDTNSGFKLDEYIQEPYAVAYRQPGTQSIIRNFVNGTSTLIEPPATSEKTPINEELRSLAVSGAEVTEGFASKMSRLTNRAIQDHVTGHKMLKFKQSLDVIRTGSFPALGLDGKSLGLNIDFGRDSENDLVYDFTATGASFADAMVKVQKQARNQGGPIGDLVAVLGADWATKFGSDTSVTKYLDTNMSNLLLEAPMALTKLKNTQGLLVLGRYRDLTMKAPIWVCTLDFDTPYIPYKGAVAQDWMPDDEAFFFSLRDKRYNIRRGVTVFDGSGNSVREVGDVVFDTFSENDPIIDYLRSNTCHVFVPANVNHTYRVTGTFAEAE